MNKGAVSSVLEETITNARAGVVPMSALARAIMDADLALPSAEEVRADGSGFEPLFFDKEGTGMLVAFTNKSYALQYAKVASYCLVMKGKDVLRRLPHQYGLVINPGRDIGFDISPEGIQKMLNDFA